MIGPGSDGRVIVATVPVNFLKGADSLAALVKAQYDAHLLSGVAYVFRANKADRSKLVRWAGIDLCAKRLKQGGFRPPCVRDSVIRLTAAQMGDAG